MRTTLAFILLSALGLSSCSYQMRNEDIVKQAKFCEQSGLEAEVIRDGIGERVVAIECVPKGQEFK